MVLSDRDIWMRQMSQSIIEPFDLGHLKPASVDLRLGDFIIRFPYDRGEVHTLGELDKLGVQDFIPASGLLLDPGEFILAQTFERVTIPDDLVARVEGKSTTGRSGLLVHVTAGYIDPGFSGVITLELCNLRRCRLRLEQGVSIAQLSLLQMTSAAKSPYRGRYQGANAVESAKGPDGAAKITLTDEVRDRADVDRPGSSAVQLAGAATTRARTMRRSDANGQPAAKCR
jgi:dCTP deaminase